MIIKSIKLFNFRNHVEYSLLCQDNTSLILGENGSGKTSVLEAIYILTRGKSFRAVDSDIIRRNADFYRIELEYNNGEFCTATYDNINKTFIIAGKKYRRLPAKHKYPVVLFQPSDLNLFSHSPSSRRDYFDRIFSQFNDSYTSILSKYEKALKQRNELLKSDYTTKDALFSWNILLAKYGTDLFSYRQKFIQEINNNITKVYRSIANNNDMISIIYKTNINSADDNAYLGALEASYTKDSYLGHTSFGIHRDDYIFNFNNQPASGSASRGESRSIILALKFIEADLIQQKTNLKPIILLDDVFSELDPTRRRCLVKNFKNHQVIITSVEDITKNK